MFCSSNEYSAVPSQFEQMLGLAQRSQDELFHIALYNWLIQADLTDKLLEVLSVQLKIFNFYCSKKMSCLSGQLSAHLTVYLKKTYVSL